MENCVLTRARGMFGESGERLGTTLGYSVRTEETLAGLDKRTGQVVLDCLVEGCGAELEVYPSEHTPNIYFVVPESLGVARFVCKSEKEN